MARPGISTKKYRKNTPRAEILEPQENTPKIPEKIPKCAFLVFWGYFFGIFGVFWGQILGVQNFGPGGIFSVFLVETPGQAISGGRGVLKCCLLSAPDRVIEVVTAIVIAAPLIAQSVVT